MKNILIYILHLLFGFENYLWLFSIIKIKILRLDKRKADFLYFEKTISPTANIIVIGACTGITTIPFAKSHSKRKIFAYEPLLSNFNVLKKIITFYKLDNISIFNIGLGENQEEREFVLPVVNGIKKQGLAHIVDSTILEYNEGIINNVKLDKLDQREEIKSIEISAIKIVAENFESYIFKGAKNTILKNRPIIYCELWNNQNRKKVFSIVENFNYSIYYRKGNFLLPFNENDYLGKNFFFRPNDL